MTQRVLLAALCLAAVAGGLNAANVFVMPGTSGQTLNIVGTSTLGTPVTVPNMSGAFLALARPDGERFYILSRNRSDQTLVILDRDFNVVAKKALGDDVTSALITPDGKKLVVLTAVLRVFDTETGNEIVSPTQPDVGAGHEDMAVSQDSKYVFVLSSSARRVIAINISGTNFTIAGSVLLTGGVYTGLATGPNGIIYASMTNQVVAIDPVTITQYGAEMSVNGLPGRLSFTPDGLRAVAVNSQTITGSSAFVFDLPNRTTSKVSTIPEVLDDVLVVSNSRAIARSTGGNLYEITISPASIAQAAIAGQQAISNVTGIAISNELPNAKHLYVTTATVGAGSSISHIDLTGTGLSETDRVVLAETSGKVSYAGAASGGPVVSALTINNNQSVVVSSTLSPLIARFLDIEGKPVASAPVTWSTGTAEVLITSSETTTTKEGFVRAQVTAPATPGPYTVLATSGTAKATFNFSAATATSGGGDSGGGTTTSSGGISIYSGNGQLVPEYSSGNAELMVLVKKADGTLASGEPVTYEVTSGPVSVAGSDTYTCSGTTCTTDSTGKTGIKFTASSASYASFVKALVTARLTNGASVVFYIVIYMRADVMGNTAEGPRISIVKPDFGETLTGGVGSTLKDAVEAKVYAGAGPMQNQPIPSVSLTVTTGYGETEGPTAKCQDNLLTDSNGLAVCDVTFGGQLGEAPLTVSVGLARSWPRRLKVTAGEAAIVRIAQGNNQTGTPGQKLTLSPVVIVSDASGNVLAGQLVSWEIVQSGSMTLSNVKNITDANGKASCDVALGQTAGIVTLKVKAGNASATFSFTVNLKIGSLVKTGGDLQSAEPGKPFAEKLGVQVLDESGKGISGVQVAFSVLSGYAIVSPATVTTDLNGKASTSVTAGSQAGTIKIRAAIGTITQDFTLTARPAGPVVTSAGFRNAASNQQGVTPGGLVVISGSAFADGLSGLVNATATQGVYPTQLNGIEVRFNGYAAPILWARNQSGVQEVEVQVPFEVTAGTASVAIRSTSGTSSTVSNVVVKALDPGIFETNSSAVPFATATRPDGTQVNPSNPARRGERIRFFVTGAGQASPLLSTNVPAVSGQSILNDVVTGLDNAGITTVSAVALEGSIGMYAITVEIPESWPTGMRALAFAVKGANGEWVFAKDSALPVQ